MSKRWSIIAVLGVLVAGGLLMLILAGAFLMRGARTRIVLSPGFETRSGETFTFPFVEEGGSFDSSQFPFPERGSLEGLAELHSFHGRGHFGSHGFGPSGFSHFGRGSISPFGGFGALLKLATMGLLGYLVYRLWQRRKDGKQEAAGDATGGGRIVDDLENEIRVGEEVQGMRAANEAGVTNIDDLTEEDLLRAMKRLGIRKLEL